MIQFALNINEKHCISDSTKNRDSIIDRFALERRKRDAQGNVFFGKTVIIRDQYDISSQQIS